MTLQSVRKSIIFVQSGILGWIYKKIMYKDVNIGTFIKLRLRCMGHAQQADNARNTKKIYQANLHQKQPNGRPKARWKYDGQNGIREMEIVKW
jgi:hypothetical protein